MSEFESIFESIVGRLRKDYKVGGRVESNVHYYGTNNKKGFATQGFRQSQADKIVKLKEILTKWKNGELKGKLVDVIYREDKHLRGFLRDFLEGKTSFYNPENGLRKYVTIKEIKDTVGADKFTELKESVTKSAGIKSRTKATGDATAKIRKAQMQADVSKLKKDPVIKRLIKTGSKNVITDLRERAQVVLKTDSPNTAIRRLQILGEQLNEKNQGNPQVVKKLRRAGAFVGQPKLSAGKKTSLALGQKENFVDRALRDIAKKLKANNIRGYNLDEIYGGTSSGYRGSYPYGVFGQIIKGGKVKPNTLTINKELINQAKGFSLDSAKSRVEEKLQNLDSEYEKYKEVKKRIPSRQFGYRNYKPGLSKKQFQLKIMNDFNKQALEFKRINKVAVPLFSDKPPSQTVGDYKNFKNPKSKFYFEIGGGRHLSDAMDDVYKQHGYSLKVPKNTGTLKTILKDLDNPNVINNLKNKIGTNRLLSTVGIPTPDMITRLIPEITSPLAVDYSNMQLGEGRLAKSAGVIKNVAKILGKGLGLAAIPLEVANMLNMRKQGKTTAEILGSPFFLSGRIGEAQDLLKMTPLERQAVSEQQIAGDESMLDTDFYTPRQEGIEAVDIEAVKERVRKQREEEERQRALERSKGKVGFTYPNMYGITSVKGVI
tara:strand:- start:18 stop:1991 length:1974 start_codon:yes stop_codon:yes gene_type:complete